MGKIIIQGSGGGGADPDEISARAGDVLRGKTTIDSEGEVVEGSIEVYNSSLKLNDVKALYTNERDIGLFMPAAYYKPNKGQTTVDIPKANLAKKLGVDGTKILANYEVLGVKGSIPTKGSYARCEDIAVGSSDMNLYFNQGYYHNRPDTTGPALVVKFDQFGKRLGIDGAKMLADYNVLGVKGSIPKRGVGGQNTPGINTGTTSMAVYLHSGYYEPRNGGADYPYITVPYSLLSQKLNIDASKMLENYTIAGVKGTIPISKTNKDHVKTMDIGHAWGDDRGLLYVIRLEYDGQYIPPVAKGGYLYVGVKEPDLKPENIIAGKTIGRVTGGIKVMGGTSHNVNGTRGGYDAPTQRFYCDIERGAYINNCWSGYPEIGIHRDVFIQNLGIRPELLRKGYSLFGVEGTMPDYSAGRVVFNGATFDGVLCSGVATGVDKKMAIAQEIRYSGQWDSLQLTNFYDNHNSLEYLGVNEGGLRFHVSNRNGYRSLQHCYVGLAFSNSINLTPFRKMKVVARKWGWIQGTPNGVSSFNIAIFFGKLGTITKQNAGSAEYYLKCTKEDGVSNLGDTNYRKIDEWETKEIDISSKQGQHYIGIGVNGNGIFAADTCDMHAVITHIEFIN